MRIGVVGCGSIGKRHVKNLVALGHEPVIYDAGPVTIVPVGVCVMSGLGGLMACAAVMICTPASTHTDVARELLALGYRGPLFVEKPLALSTDECDVFRAWPSPVTMVGYMLRLHPAAQAMKALRPTRGAMTCWCDMRAWPGTYGDPALENSHELDLALYLGASPTVTEAKTFKGGYGLSVGGWDCDFDWCNDDYLREWLAESEADGTHLHATFSRPFGDELYRAELAHFLACVENNEPTMTPFADGIRVVDACEQAMKLAGANV